MIVDQPPTLHPYTALKVVLLSGLSDPATCALSEQQMRFLESLDAPEEAKVWWNFPYVVCSEPRRTPPLWLASWRNTWQFFRASRNPYRDAARRHWRALVESTERLLVITLSCGIEIVNHCVDASDVSRDIHLIALGPVAFRRPVLPHTLVQGKGDYLSKLFFRRPDVEITGAGHMNYLHHPDVAQLCRELCNNTLRSSAAVSICHSAS